MSAALEATTLRQLEDQLSDPAKLAEMRAALGIVPTDTTPEEIEHEKAVADHIDESILPAKAAIDEAFDALIMAERGEHSTAQVAAQCIGALLEVQDATKSVTDRLRRLIEEIVVEQPNMKLETVAGSAAITAASVSVSYDTKRLDARSLREPEFAALVRDYRRESCRSGSLRVSRAKAVAR